MTIKTQPSVLTKPRRLKDSRHALSRSLLVVFQAQSGVVAVSSVMQVLIGPLCSTREPPPKANGFIGRLALVAGTK